MKLKEMRRDADKIAEAMRVALEKKGKPASCEGVGCNGCCRGELLVLPEEAHYISQQMDEAAWERVGAAGEALKNDPVHTVCPLLDPESGACSVYKHRPAVCRLYMAISPRSQCFEFLGVKNVDVPDWCVSYLIALMAEYKEMDLYSFARSDHPTTLGSYLYRAWQKKNGVPEAELIPLRNTMSIVEDHEHTDRTGVERVPSVRSANVAFQRAVHLGDRRSFLRRRGQDGDPRRAGFHYRY